jgi:hypothetical protein
MVVEILVAVSLPVWLCAEEIARIRSQRPRPVVDREAVARDSRREAVLPAA